MRITIILISAVLFFNLNLNGQTRTIVGRVISEDIVELPEVNIQDIDTLLLGKTDIDGLFIINIPPKTDKLLFSWIGMEWTEITLQDDCDTIEVVLLYDAIYDFISSKRIDRLRKKRFDKLPNLHSMAVEQGLFANNTICYDREFKPDKPSLDRISLILKSKRKQIKKAFREFMVGDTVSIPYSGTWRYDGTDRTTLHSYSYVVDGESFDCIIKGVITEKNKDKNRYNLVYRIIDCKSCNYDNLVIDGKELAPGVLIDYNMKYFKILIE